MSNMFKETSKYSKPISVEDSVKTDRVINNLWCWCSRIETLGMVLFLILIIIGVITAVISGFETIGINYSGKPKVEFNFGTFIVNLINSALYAFIEYCAYHIIALLIGALASITQHTKATAKLLEYQLSKDDPISNNEWKCKNCGKVNSDYVGTCSCGNTKAENELNN